MVNTTHDTGVLVPGITAPSTVACVRSLGRRDIVTVVGAASRNTPATVSRYCDAVVDLPAPSDGLSAYADALVSLAARNDVRTVVPVREADVFVLSKHRDEFAAAVETPWPEFGTLRRVQDRLELFESADAAGVDAPETARLDEWDDWSRKTITKPRYSIAAPDYLGTDGHGRTVGSTVYNEPNERPDIDACVDERGHVPIVQEYVSDSNEYGFFALYDHGEAVATFQHCQRRGYKYPGGPSAYRESVRIPELEAAGRALLDELEWHGLAMVEFLRDPETGAFKLMEVNPRFWSSLPFSVRAGADFPYYYWQLASGQPVEQPPYEVGIGGHLLRGELCYLHSVATETYPFVEKPTVASAVRDVLISLVRDPRFDYAVANDPRPFVRDCLNAVRPGLEALSPGWLRFDHGDDVSASATGSVVDGASDGTATTDRRTDGHAEAPVRVKKGD